MDAQPRSRRTAGWLLGTAVCMGGMPAMAVELTSVDGNETHRNFQSHHPTVSATARFVAFESDATHWAANDVE